MASILPPGSDLRIEALVSAQPSGLGWLPDGRLLIVSMRDCRILRRETDGTLVVRADLLGRHGSSQRHGGRCLRTGVRGHFGFDMAVGDDFAPASLCKVDLDGSVVEVTTLAGDTRLQKSDT